MGSYFDGKWRGLKKNQSNIERLRRIFPEIKYYDLGSTGGTPPPFCWFEEGMKIYNFEPDKRGESNENGQTLPIAVGPESLKKIYLNRRPTTSSLLEPNRDIVNRYDFSQIFKHEDQDIFATDAVEPIETMGLDNIIDKYNLGKPDFVKIDVQGLTYEVLQTASKSLSHDLVGIEMEVEFFECYKAQHSFGTVHEIMLSQGFEIFKVKNINSWYYKTQVPIRRYNGQDTFCDFIYFRNIDSIGEDSVWNEHKALVVILVMLMYDLIDSAAAYYERFLSEGILEKSDEIEEVLSTWEESLYHFFDSRTNDNILKTLLKKFWNASPRSIYEKLKRIDL